MKYAVIYRYIYQTPDKSKELCSVTNKKKQKMTSIWSNPILLIVNDHKMITGSMAFKKIY